MVHKTYYPKASELQPQWLLVDASGQNLGRLATKIATLLLGKHKASFTPGVKVGDYVVVINAAHVTVTGTKTGNKLTAKQYYRHSGYPGGLKVVALRDQLRLHPERVIRHAVWGMLPHNRLGRHLLKRLKVYGGAEHPHGAQNPQPV